MSFSDSPSHASVSECGPVEPERGSEAVSDAASLNIESVAVGCTDAREGPTLASPGLIGVGLTLEDRSRMESTEWELSSSSAESNIAGTTP